MFSSIPSEGGSRRNVIVIVIEGLKSRSLTKHINVY